MAKIYSLTIKNYRGFEEFTHKFGREEFICLIGRGDSGKTTILDAISKILSSNWNIKFYDSDFYNNDIEKPIQIEAILYDLPKELMVESKFGLYKSVLDKQGKIIDDLSKLDRTNDYVDTLSIKLIVEKDLQPKWFVVNSRNQDEKEFRPGDRARLNVFLVSDYLDKHFSWGRGSPLYSILQTVNPNPIDSNQSSAVIDALREAKSSIDGSSFSHFDEALKKIKESSAHIGLDVDRIDSTVDFKDIFVGDNKISLHNNYIPLRQSGKGSKRLLSIAIQMLLASRGGIILIDEIEQGLEPDRAQHLARMLKQHKGSQVIITTHSRDVLVELQASDIYKVLSDNKQQLLRFDKDLQGILRSNPEPFFAKRVIVCEGLTEIGIFISLDTYRASLGKPNAALLGVRYANGQGSSTDEYARGLLRVGYQVCLVCDSDDSSFNKKKNELAKMGAIISDCEDGKSIEEQSFHDLPWKAIQELIGYIAEENAISEKAMYDTINAKHKKLHDKTLPEDWRKSDGPEIRLALGVVAKDKKWFKRIDHGKKLGEVFSKNIGDISEKQLGKQLKIIFDWLDEKDV